MFKDKADCGILEQGNELEVKNLREQTKSCRTVIHNMTRNIDITVKLELSDKEVMMILAEVKPTYVRDKTRHRR